MKPLVQQRLSVVDVIEAGRRAAKEHEDNRPPYMEKSPDPIADLSPVIRDPDSHRAPVRPNFR